ncbi:MAG: hypothetical protein LBK53_09260 [Heliobacteriaceae bacterium]|jgi:hypothetical protein|nr:hypothetical protein [Heliobacteriaceae bacterium]
MAFFQTNNKQGKKTLRQQFNDDVDRQTMSYQQKYGFELSSKSGNRTWNVEADAFKHTFMQARLTFDWTTAGAKTLGDYHEFIEGFSVKQPAHERNMDLWNNRVGQKIGREVRRELIGQKIRPQSEIDDIFAEKIMQKMRAGELITTPDDPRAKILGEKFTDFINQPKDFTRLQPKKFDELMQTPVQGISGTQADFTPLNIIQPQPAVLVQNTTSWLGQLGSVLSGIGNLVQLGVGIASGTGALNPGTPTGIGISITEPAFQLDTSAQIVGYGAPELAKIKWPKLSKHTGGKTSGKDEVLAILRGGETVRTEAQEQELQQEKYAQFMEAVRPYLEEQNNKPKSIAEAYDPDNKIPCLLNKTTQDEEIIIAIVAQAWKSNRLGFRNILRYE